MFVRSLVFVVCIALLLVATTRRARASNAAAPQVWKPLPPPIETSKGDALRRTFEQLGRSCHRATFAMRERNNDPFREARDGATSLGVRAPSVSGVGASAAAIGASVWLFASRRGKTPAVVVGPRLYSGGGGIGLYVRW